MPEQQPAANPPAGPSIQFKVSDEILRGVYANMLYASHTKEEFILDFLNAFGPQGIEVAKVIISPGHFKRIVAALADNLQKYEERFGIIEKQTPQAPQISTSESNKFGF